MSYGHKCHHPGPGIRFWLGKHHCKTVSRDMALCADMEQKHMEQHLENDILHILSCHICNSHVMDEDLFCHIIQPPDRPGIAQDLQGVAWMLFVGSAMFTLLGMPLFMAMVAARRVGRGGRGGRGTKTVLHSGKDQSVGWSPAGPVRAASGLG